MKFHTQSCLTQSEHYHNSRHLNNYKIVYKLNLCTWLQKQREPWTCDVDWCHILSIWWPNNGLNCPTKSGLSSLSVIKACRQQQQWHHRVIASVSPFSTPETKCRSVTSSSAVTDRPHDALCLSAVQYIKRNLLLLVTLINLCIQLNSALFSLA